MLVHVTFCMTRTIFYSWQSDLPNRTNRGFIGDCLRRSVEALRSANVINEGLDIDRDTLNEQGSPEIAETILQKIRKCDVFVADVTIINTNAPPPYRKTPNPNVLVELGFAAHARTWDRILCVANSSFGSEQDLPFDIRHRRVILYDLPEDAESKDEARKQLVGILTSRIGEVLSGNLRLLSRELRSLFDQIDTGIMVAVGQGIRTLTVDVPAVQAQVLQQLSADPDFATLATFQLNGNFMWNDHRGPRKADCPGWPSSFRTAPRSSHSAASQGPSAIHRPLGQD
jgi:hypothetical protein